MIRKRYYLSSYITISYFTERPMYILPWIVNAGIDILYSVVEICFGFANFAETSMFPWEVTVFNVIAILLAIYFATVVLSFHNKLKSQHTGTATSIRRA